MTRLIKTIVPRPSMSGLRRRLPPLAIVGVVGALLFAAGTPPAQAQPVSGAVSERAGVTRQPLQRHDLSLPGREVVQSVVHVEPGGSFPLHRHPGEEAIYVLAGTLVYELEGQVPVTVGPGGVLFIPAGVVHSARNVGSGTASELATHIVDISRPLLTLAE